MALKILFTLAVAVIVIILFRHRRARVAQSRAEDDAGSIAPRAVAYGLLAALVGVALLIFILQTNV